MATNQNSSDLTFNATLNDNVSPVADQIAKKMQQLGASQAQIKIFVQAYDQASEKAAQIKKQMDAIPKEAKLRVSAQTEEAEKKISKLHEIAKAPITMAVHVKDNTEEVIGSMRQKFQSFRAEITHGFMNMPILGAGLHAVQSGSQMASGMAGNLLNVGGMGTGALGLGSGAAVAGLVTKSFQVNMQTQQQLVQLTSILKNPAVAQQQVQQIAQWNLNTPFNLAQSQAANVQLRTYGVPQSSPINMNTVGNVAAATNKNPADVAYAMAGAYRGDLRMLPTYGLNIQQTDLQPGGRFYGQSPQAAIAHLANQQYGGGMVAQSKTLQGSFTNIQDIVQQQLIGKGGSGLFNQVSQLEQKLESTMRSFHFQTNLGKVIDEARLATERLWQTVQKGVTYFKTNLEAPIKQLTNTVVTFGKVAAETFGGTVLTGVKALGEAFQTVVVPLAKLVGGVPALAQVVGLMKGMQMLGMGNVAKPFEGFAHSALTLNPIGMVKNTFGMAAKTPEIVGLLGIKSILDQAGAGQSMSHAFTQFNTPGHMRGNPAAVPGLKMWADVFAGSNDVSPAQMMTFMSQAANSAPITLNSAQRANFMKMGALGIAQLGMQGFGKDAGGLFLSEVKGQKLGYGDAATKQAFNTVENAVRGVADIFNEGLKPATQQVVDAFHMFSTQITQRGLTPAVGGGIAAGILGVTQRTGVTRAELNQLGTQSPQDVTKYLLNATIQPTPFDINTMLKYGNPLQMKRGGISKNAPGDMKDIQDLVSQHQTASSMNQQAVQQVNQISGTKDGSKFLPPANLAQQYGLNIDPKQLTSMQGILQANQNMVQVQQKLSDAIGNTNTKMQNLQNTQQIYAWASNALNEKLEKFNYSMTKMQRPIQDMQIALQNFTNNVLTPMQIAMEKLQNQMAVYQHQAIVPLQRAQEDWNQKMVYTSNAIEDVTYALGKAQYNMNKFTSGLLGGEQKVLDNIHAMERYNQQLQLLKDQNMSMQADLTRTTVDQGFKMTVKPMMGFALEGMTKIGQQRLAVAQDQYNLTFGEQHYQMQRAASYQNPFQDTGQSFQSRMKGIQKEAGAIAGLTVKNRSLTDEQHNQVLVSRQLEIAMYKATVAMRPMEDAQFAMGQRIFQATQSMEQQQLTMSKMQAAYDSASRGVRPLEDQQHQLAMKNYEVNASLIATNLQLSYLTGLLDDARTESGKLNDALQKMIDPGNREQQIKALKKYIDDLAKAGIIPKSTAKAYDDMFDQMEKSFRSHSHGMRNAHIDMLTEMKHDIEGIYGPTWVKLFSLVSNSVGSVVGQPLGTAAGLGTAGLGGLYTINAIRLGMFKHVLPGMVRGLGSGIGSLLPFGIPQGIRDVGEGPVGALGGLEGGTLGGLVKSGAGGLARMMSGGVPNTLTRPWKWLQGFGADLFGGILGTAATGNPILGGILGKGYGWGVEASKLPGPLSIMRGAWQGVAHPLATLRQAGQDAAGAAGTLDRMPNFMRQQIPDAWIARMASRMGGGPDAITQVLGGTSTLGRIGSRLSPVLDAVAGNPLVRLLGRVAGPFAGALGMAGRAAGAVALPLDIGMAAFGHGANQRAGIGGVAGSVIGGAAGVLGGPFAPLTVPMGAAIGGTVGAIVGNFWPQITKFFSSGMPKALSSATKAVGNFINGIIKSVDHFFTRSIPNAAKGIGNWVNGIVKSIDGFFSHSLGPVGKIIAGFVSPIVHFFATAFNGGIKVIGSVFSGIGHFFADIGKGIWHTISHVIGDLWKAVADLFSGNILGVLKNIGKAILDFGSGLANMWWTAITDIVSAIANVFSSIAQAIWNGIKSLPGEIFGGIKSVFSGAAHMLGFAGGIDYVPKDDTKAHLHQGEAVLGVQDASLWRKHKNVLYGAASLGSDISPDSQRKATQSIGPGPATASDQTRSPSGINSTVRSVLGDQIMEIRKSQRTLESLVNTHVNTVLRTENTSYKSRQGALSHHDGRVVQLTDQNSHKIQTNLKTGTKKLEHIGQNSNLTVESELRGSHVRQQRQWHDHLGKTHVVADKGFKQVHHVIQGWSDKINSLVDGTNGKISSLNSNLNSLGTGAGGTGAGAGNLLAQLPQDAAQVSALHHQIHSLSSTQTKNYIGNIQAALGTEDPQKIQQSQYGDLYNRLVDHLQSVEGASGSAARRAPVANIQGLAGGLDNVPYDNYHTQLHQGEAVLTAAQAHVWRQQKGIKSNVNQLNKHKKMPAAETRQKLKPEEQIAQDFSDILDWSRNRALVKGSVALSFNKLASTVVPHFAGGTGASITQDTPAVLHQNEAVIKGAPGQIDKQSHQDMQKQSELTHKVVKEHYDKLSTLSTQHNKAEKTKQQIFEDARVQTVRDHNKLEQNDRNDHYQKVTKSFGDFISNNENMLKQHNQQSLDMIQTAETSQFNTYNTGWQHINDVTTKWIESIHKQISGIDKSLGLTGPSSSSSAPAAPKKKAHGGLVKGGQIDKGELVRVGEEGFDEMVIPLAPHRRDRAASLIKQTVGIMGGHHTGVQHFANGGVARAARRFSNGGFAGYVNPMKSASGIVPERIDMGVDYAFNSGSLLDAIGKAKINYASTGSGWPGGGFINSTFLDGPMSGRNWYVAEDITPLVKVGDTVNPGQHIARYFSGGSGTEWGWAGSSGTDMALAAVLGQQSHSGDPGAVSSAVGKNFSDFLHSLGAPAGVLQGAISGTLPKNWPTSFPAFTSLKDVPKELKKFGPLGVRMYGTLKRKLDQWNKKLSAMAGSQGSAQGSVALPGGWFRVGATIDNTGGQTGDSNMTFAELLEAGTNRNLQSSDLTHLLGYSQSGSYPYGMPLGSKILIRSPGSGTQFTITKNDVGSGQPGNAHFKVDLHPGIASALHWTPNNDVEVKHAAGGVKRVPYDNFLRLLHKDERVLSAAEAHRLKEDESSFGDRGFFNLIKELFHDLKHMPRELKQIAKSTAEQLRLVSGHPLQAVGSFTRAPHSLIATPDRQDIFTRASHQIPVPEGAFGGAAFAGGQYTGQLESNLQGLGNQMGLGADYQAITNNQAILKGLQHQLKKIHKTKGKETKQDKKDKHHLQKSIHAIQKRIHKEQATYNAAAVSWRNQAEAAGVATPVIEEALAQIQHQAPTSDRTDPITRLLTGDYLTSLHAVKGNHLPANVARAVKKQLRRKAPHSTDHGTPHVTVGHTGQHGDTSQAPAAHLTYAAGHATHESTLHAAGSTAKETNNRLSSIHKTLQDQLDIQSRTYFGALADKQRARAAGGAAKGFNWHLPGDHALDTHAAGAMPVIDQQVNKALQQARSDLRKLNSASAMSHNDLRALQALAKEHGLTAKQHVAIAKAISATQRAIREEGRARGDTLKAIAALKRAHIALHRGHIDLTRGNNDLLKALHMSANTRAQIQAKHKAIAEAHLEIHKAHLEIAKAHKKAVDALRQETRAHHETTKAVRDAINAHHQTTKAMHATLKDHTAVMRFIGAAHYGETRGVHEQAKNIEGHTHRAAKHLHFLTRGGESGYAGGMLRVPFDGLLATLHQDEAVLTAPQAQAYRAQRSGIGLPLGGINDKEMVSLLKDIHAAILNTGAPVVNVVNSNKTIQSDIKQAPRTYHRTK